MALTSLVLTLGLASQAQSNSSRSTLSAPAHPITNLAMAVGEDLYLGANQPSYSPAAAASLSELGLHWQRLMPTHAQFGWAVDASTQWHAQDRALYIDVRDAYYQTRFLSGELSLGRRRMSWSEADDQWRLGLWQPRILRDKLARPAVGLIGLFWQSVTPASPWQIQVLASPAYVPDLGPDLKIIDHSFSTPNPWFHTPPPTVLISGVETNIHYSLTRPNNEAMIQHPGAALKVQYQLNPRDHLQLSLAHKPIQQLVLAFPYYLFVGPSERYVAVELAARVLYQKIATLEYVMGPQNRNWRAWASLTHEVPVNTSVPSSWVSQQLSPATLTNFYFASSLNGEGFSKIGTPILYTTFTYLNGGDSPDLGPKIGKQESVFESRFFYKRALTLGLQDSWLLKGQDRFSMDLHGTFDFAQAGLQVSAQLRYDLNPRWRVAARADWLTLTHDPDTQKSTGFFSNYRANDRMHLEVTYVF